MRLFRMVDFNGFIPVSHRVESHQLFSIPQISLA